jgi:peptidoglycan hydrolase CwlO-like protein
MAKGLLLLVTAGVLATVLFAQLVGLKTPDPSTAERQINEQVAQLRSQLKDMEVEISSINEQLDDLNEQKTRVQEQRRMDLPGLLEGP